MSGKEIDSLLVKIGVDASGVKPGMDRAAKGVDAGVDKMEDSLHGFETETKRSFARAGDGTASFVDKLAKVGISFQTLKFAVQNTIGTAASFEQAMSKVGALANSSKEDIKKLSDAAVELGSKTVFSATQAAEGMQNLAAAGFNTSQIIQAMPGLLDGAAASGAGFAQTTDIIVGTLGGFGLAASEAAHVADVLAAAANQSTANMSDLGNSLKYVAPLARASGISFEEVSSALAIMANAGIKGEQAGTQLRGALSSIINPASEATAAMKAAGLSFFDSSGHMKGLGDIAAELQSKLGSLTEQQRNEALASIFGRESLGGMLALMQSGKETIDKTTESFKASDGAAKTMAETMQSNFLGAVEQLKGSLESLSITTGNVFLPALTDSANASSGLIASLTDLAKETLPIVGEALKAITGISLVQWLEQLTRSIKLLADAIALGKQIKSLEFGGDVNVGTIMGRGLDLINTILAGSSAATGGHASGGLITGPGSGTSDSILTRVSAGEFVVNAASTSKNLPLLNALNAPGMVAGGLVGGSARQFSDIASGIDVDASPVLESLAREIMQQELERGLQKMQATLMRSAAMLEFNRGLGQPSPSAPGKPAPPTKPTKRGAFSGAVAGVETPVDPDAIPDLTPDAYEESLAQYEKDFDAWSKQLWDAATPDFENWEKGMAMYDAGMEEIPEAFDTVTEAILAGAVDSGSALQAEYGDQFAAQAQLAAGAGTVTKEFADLTETFDMMSAAGKRAAIQDIGVLGGDAPAEALHKMFGELGQGVDKLYTQMRQQVAHAFGPVSFASGFGGIAQAQRDINETLDMLSWMASGADMAGYYAQQASEMLAGMTISGKDQTLASVFLQHQIVDLGSAAGAATLQVSSLADVVPYALVGVSALASGAVVAAVGMANAWGGLSQLEQQMRLAQLPGGPGTGSLLDEQLRLSEHGGMGGGAAWNGGQGFMGAASGQNPWDLAAGMRSGQPQWDHAGLGAAWQQGQGNLSGGGGPQQIILQLNGQQIGEAVRQANGSWRDSNVGGGW